MEIRFTASVMMAVSCVVRLAQGVLWVRPKGAYIAKEPWGGVKLEQPGWCNFDFFSRIKASPIRRTKRIEPRGDRLGAWELERRVEFFHRGHRVAVVHLVGLRIDGDPTSLDNGSGWAISRLGYSLSSEENPEWREIELEVVSYTSALVTY